VTIEATRSPADVRLDPVAGLATEGLFESETDGPPTFGSLRQATGDFVLMAPTEEGLLVGTGRGGGHRAVYVATTPEGFVVSTRLERLLATLPERPRLDVDALARYAVLEPSVDATVTPYVGVRQVPPGEAWLVRPGSIHRERMVRPLRAGQAVGSHADLAQMVREELEHALRRCLRGVRHFAIAASGGLDSSALVGLACSLARRGLLEATPRVYHWNFDVPPPRGDTPYLRALARHLSIEAGSIVPTDASCHFRDHLIVDGLPCFFAVLPFWTALASRARRDGADVVVTGEGGDQTMTGQPLLLAELVRRGSPLVALQTAARMRGAEAGTLRWRLGDLILRPQIARLAPEALRRLRRRRELLQRYPWAGPRLRRYLENVSAPSPRRPSLDWSPNEWYEALLDKPAFEFRHVIRTQEEIVGSHARRDPYLDDGFLRAVATIPPLAFFEGNYSRSLQREAMRGLVPDEVRLRKTKANVTRALVDAMAPLGGFRLVEHLADVRMMADAGLVEPSKFRARFDQLVRQPIDVAWLDVWAVLSTEALMRCQGGEVERAA
jgi:asparagine synthase (glutamine-hydrolysing)